MVHARQAISMVIMNFQERYWVPKPNQEWSIGTICHFQLRRPTVWQRDHAKSGR